MRPPRPRHRAAGADAWALRRPHKQEHENNPMHSSGGVEAIGNFDFAPKRTFDASTRPLPTAHFRFDTSGKTLAEWHHRKFVVPARRDPPRVFSCRPSPVRQIREPRVWADSPTDFLDASGFAAGVRYAISIGFSRGSVALLQRHGFITGSRGTASSSFTDARILSGLWRRKC